jgi:hypothetical protein
MLAGGSLPGAYQGVVLLLLLPHPPAPELPPWRHEPATATAAARAGKGPVAEEQQHQLQPQNSRVETRHQCPTASTPPPPQQTAMTTDVCCCWCWRNCAAVHCTSCRQGSLTTVTGVQGHHQRYSMHSNCDVHSYNTPTTLTVTIPQPHPEAHFRMQHLPCL